MHDPRKEWLDIGKQLSQDHGITEKYLTLAVWRVAEALAPGAKHDCDVWFRVFANLDLDTQRAYVNDVVNDYPQAAVGPAHVG